MSLNQQLEIIKNSFRNEDKIESISRKVMSEISGSGNIKHSDLEKLNTTIA